MKASDYSTLFWTFGPIVLLVAFWFIMMRRMSGGASGGGPGGVFNVGKSKPKVFDREKALMSHSRMLPD